MGYEQNTSSSEGGRSSSRTVQRSDYRGRPGLGPARGQAPGIRWRSIVEDRMGS
jgi:hypothetical protein